MSYLSFDRDRFAENIKAARKRLKLTQEEVAKQLGINQGTFSGYEKGDVMVPIQKLGELLNALQCEFLDLWGHSRDDRVSIARPLTKSVSSLVAKSLRRQYLQTLKCIANDPAVMLHLGTQRAADITNRDAAGIIRNLCDTLRINQRRIFITYTLRYLTIVNEYGLGSPESHFILNFVRDRLLFSFLKPSDLGRISGDPPSYTPKDLKKVFPNQATRHVLLWLMALQASTNSANEAAWAYIEKLAKQLEISDKTVRYIKDVNQNFNLKTALASLK